MSARGGAPRLDSIFASQRCYKFSSFFYIENKSNQNVQSLIGPGGKIKIVSKVMEKMPEIFTSQPILGDDVKFIGRLFGKRDHRFIKRRFLENNDYLDNYKLLIPEANNSGKYGETLAEPLLGEPGVATSDTFLNAGPFETRIEAINLSRYYKTKFFRALLGVRKVTQHSPSQVWKTIPLQNFHEDSDIKWKAPIPEIDNQLYEKYGLDSKEISFIESHVKEMS